MTPVRTLIQHSRGQTTRQTHRDVGELREDLLTRQGFDGRNAVLYRENQPTAYRATGRFRTTVMHADQLRTDDLESVDGWPRRLFYNDDVTVSLSRRRQSMPWFRRNVDGDECWFVHEGRGRVDTEFGPIDFEPGDFVVLPKAVTHRWTHHSPESLLLVVETFDELRAPTYVGLGRHAPFDPDVLRVPEPAVLNEQTDEYEIRVKYDGEICGIFQNMPPCDVVGWKGDYFPFAFNIRDWNVVMSDSLHLPPSMHVFLIAEGVNIINLLPRPYESVRGVQRLPFYHRNADYDELTLLHGGQNLGKALTAGLLIHDPQGIHHGFPDSARDLIEREWEQHTRVDWKMIMVETRRPLKLDDSLRNPDQA